MVDVTSTARWWADWELRILVLGSLCLQWFLLLAGPMRSYSIRRVFRACIGLAYVSSNALAIYALGVLFNRHLKAIATGSSGGTGTGSKQQESILELLWAPILLIHLGGKEEVAAHSVEDNKQWVGDTVTFASKVAVAMYVFYKSWPNSSDRRLLAATILLFVVGIASFSEKPLAHKKAKRDRLEAISAMIQGTKRPSMWRDRMNQLLLTGHATTDDDGEGGRRRVAFSAKDIILIVLSDISLFAAAQELVDRGRAFSADVVLPPLVDEHKALRRWARTAFDLLHQSQCS
ncbi:unnamed protein product [Urochloa humidicola]